MRIAFNDGASDVERPRWRLTGGGADIDLLDGVYTIGRAAEAESISTLHRSHAIT